MLSRIRSIHIQRGFLLRLHGFIFVFLASHPVMSQPGLQLINSSLIKPEAPVMYTGLTNTLVLKGETRSNIRLERSGGPLEVRSGTAIRTRLIYKEEGMDTLRVYSNDSLILEKVYRILTPGKSMASIKNIRDSVTTATAMLEGNELEIYFKDCLYKPIPASGGFTVEIYNTDKKKIKSLRMVKSRFSEELIAELKKIQAGYTLNFGNINAKLPAVQLDSIQPFTLYIR